MVLVLEGEHSSMVLVLEGEHSSMVLVLEGSTHPWVLVLGALPVLDRKFVLMNEQEGNRQYI
jgi:hypothetical protein